MTPPLDVFHRIARTVIPILTCLTTTAPVPSYALNGMCPMCPNFDCSLCTWTPTPCPYPDQTHSVQLAIAGTVTNDNVCSIASLTGEATTEVLFNTYGATSTVAFFTHGSVSYVYNVPFTLTFEIPGCVFSESSVSMINPRIAWGAPTLSATDAQTFNTYMHMKADFPGDGLDPVSVSLTQFPDHIRLAGSVPVAPLYDESFDVSYSGPPFDDGKACYSGICATLGGPAPSLGSAPVATLASGTIQDSGENYIVARTDWATTPQLWSSSADQVELAGNILLSPPTTVAGTALLALHEVGFSLDTSFNLGLSRRETAWVYQMHLPYSPFPGGPYGAIGDVAPNGDATATFSLTFDYGMSIDSQFSYPASFTVNFDGPGFDAQNLVTISPGTGLFGDPLPDPLNPDRLLPLTSNGISCSNTLNFPAQLAHQFSVPVHVGYGPPAPPIANAGPGQSAHVGSVVTLDGSGSSDPHGLVPLAYSWSFSSRPADSVAVLSNASSVQPTFLADVPGEYQVALVATNTAGVSSAPATVLVSTTNSAPIAEAGADRSLAIFGTNVILDGTQSYDPDGDAIAYAWSFASRPAGSAAVLAGAASASPSFVADVYGEYVVQLLVSDAWSVGADTVSVSFTNLRPVADAGVGGSADAATVVILDGSASSDPNGDPLTYSWSLVSAPTGSTSVIEAPTSKITTLVPDMEGTYVVQLVVSDGLLRSEPTSIQIQSIMTTSAATDSVRRAQQSIAAVPATALKNTNMKNALTNKLNAVIASIQAGNYADALAQLEGDILGKIDGCAASSPPAPDRNDWITSCADQALIYPLVQKLIADVRALM